MHRFPIRCINKIVKPLFDIACGYNLEDARIAQLNEFLDEKKAQRIDLNTLLMVLTELKELELIHEAENEGDEYCKNSWIKQFSGCVCGTGWIT